MIDEVRARADAVQIIGRYVTLKRSGRRHWGLCPFHSEKTPSFQVHEDLQIFHCFGCGVGGDVFEFRRRHDGLDFPDAVRALAGELGVKIPDSGSEGDSRLAPLIAAHDAALDYFRTSLHSPRGKEAREYLEARGLPEDLVDRFRIGWAPGGWEGLVGHLKAKGTPLRAAEQAGLIVPRQNGDGYYDRFRGRVIFPICEPAGNTIAFGGRALGDETPKYLNSPESPIYRKGRALFGLPQALDAIRGSGRAVVVEGYFDLFALHRAGVQGVVAPCGTALTEEHARRLARYTREIVLLFDGDEAGRRAAERSLPLLLAEGLRVRASFLPEGEDPDSLIASAGPRALTARVEGATPLLDLLIDQQLAGASAHAWAASDAARALAVPLRSLADPIERQDYLRRVAARLQVPVAALEESIAEAGSRAAVPSGAAPTTARTQPIDAVSRTLVQALAAHPDLVPHFASPELARLPEGLGRLLVERLARCTRERGARALAYLSSGETDELDADQKASLMRIAADVGELDRPSAERAVRDCMARLERGALEQEYQDLAARVAVSADPTECAALLEAMQQKLEQKRLLGAVDRSP